ncbi:hypothetical protein [Marasmitruncus massiliensis]|uniref:hypothetical protein n=1 Tax=Marasmitruncus massiliensis TaxID=1944642 RepID=UPI000C79FD38|nr:hypothetical protein [Marasmitruncus massiliensis]MBE6906348.1 hypothetical protein [Oscillospiraceae bacterium]
MGRGTFISIIALLVAIAGAIVAFAAYFKYRNFVLCDDMEDDMEDDDLSDIDYYSTSVPDSTEAEETEEESQPSEDTQTDKAMEE